MAVETRRRATHEVQAFLKLARERFEQGQKAVHKQVQRELEDLAFYAGGEHQWDKETLRSRQAQQASQDGLPPVPARPCLTINKVREPVHQILNQERQNDLGIELVPADDFGDLAQPISEDEIELREGLTRRIQRESEAADARTWAFTRATIAGTGYYAVYTRYVPGKTRDKEVYVRRIYNQASVTLDPFHEQPDASDCDWEFIGGDLPWDRYKREHPHAANGEPNKVAHATDADFRALGEEYPGWFTETGDTRSARVVEYFYTEWTTKTLYDLADGRLLWADELPEDLPEDAIVDKRPVSQKQIKWAKIDAVQVLEETDWEGPDMPIIKVLGEELHPFDAERRAEGMVRPARHPAQGFNVMISKWVEMIGLAPIPPFQLPEENVGAYGAWYQLANTRTLPYLPYVQYDENGRQLERPSRTPVDMPIQHIAASVQMFDEAIKSTTLVPSVQLGQATDRHLKAKGAINALIDQAQLGTSHFTDNLKRSVRYEGQIINNLLYPIYGRPGRIARLLNPEGEPQTVRIGGGNGQAAPATTTTPSIGVGGVPNLPSAGGPARSGVRPMGAAAMGAPPMSSTAPKTYSLTPNANFNVGVKVTRSFDFRRTEEATTIGNLLQAQPELITWFGDLFFKNQDGPGHEEMAERAELMLAPPIQQMRQAKQQGGQPPDPEKQQLMQRLQQAEQILQQAKQELEGKERDAQLKKQIADDDRAWEREKLERELAAKIEIAHISAAHQHVADVREDQEEAIALNLQQSHEHAQAALARQHEREMADQQAQTAAAQSAQAHQQGLEAQAAQPPEGAA